jgi:outer membrane protein OmpA-like peptidoglycan-associated protein
MKMILMMMTALCCTVQVKADDQSYNLDTIRMEATIEPTETYQYLKPTYQKGVIVTSPWNGNWFVNISGGTNAFMGTPLGCEDLFGRMQPSVGLAIGKWFTPSIGSRISYQGFNFKNSLLDKQEYHSVHADLLWNVLGTLYREDNELRWNLFPFVGVGMIHNKTNKHNPFAISYGLQAEYSFCKRVALTMEVSNATTFQSFDGQFRKNSLGDHMLNASVGLSFKIGKIGWKKPVDHLPYVQQNEWLTDWANSMREQNQVFSDRIDMQQKTLEQLKTILEIEGLLDKYKHLFDNENITQNKYPRNNYSGLNSLRARMKNSKWDGKSPLVSVSSETDNTNTSSTGAIQTDIASFANDSLTQSLVEGQIIGAPIYFFFEINSSQFKEESQNLNIEELARVAIKHGLHITLIGAADSSTGTATINEYLSKARADYIADKLISKGVDSARIAKVFAGGIEEYSPNEANRHTKVVLSLR